MNVIFYKCADDKRVINKTLTSGVTQNCVQKDTNSILTPSIQVAQFSDFANYNYAHIPAYGRYYYIDNMTVDMGGLVVMSLSVDVLKTYAAQIKATKALIFRQSQKYNALLSDSVLQSQVNTDTITRPFTGGELSNQLGRNAHNFILTTYKGGITSGV